MPLQATCGSGPDFYLSPVPDEDSRQLEHGLWKPRVPATPVVNEVWTFDSESLCNFRGTDEIV